MDKYHSQFRPKVICIGWHKTGTTSIGEALLKLDYSVLGARLDLAEPLMHGNYEMVLKEAAKYDALQDNPWAVLYSELDKEFPGSKFILTVRDEKDWLKSAQKYFGDQFTDMRKWIYGYGSINGNGDIYLKRYREHNTQVKKYFKNRPNDLLIMDVTEGDGWGKLCSFLKTDIPDKPFPHANKGQHTLTERINFMLGKMLPEKILRRLKKESKNKHQKNRFNNSPQNQKYLSKYSKHESG